MSMGIITNKTREALKRTLQGAQDDSRSGMDFDDVIARACETFNGLVGEAHGEGVSLSYVTAMAIVLDLCLEPSKGDRAT